MENVCRGPCCWKQKYNIENTFLRVAELNTLKVINKKVKISNKKVWHPWPNSGHRPGLLFEYYFLISYASSRFEMKNQKHVFHQL